MIIVEHSRKGDITHIVEREEVDNLIKELTPGEYFTIKGRDITDPDRTYKVPTG